jgi:hypothetical protein
MGLLPLLFMPLALLSVSQAHGNPWVAAGMSLFTAVLALAGADLCQAGLQFGVHQASQRIAHAQWPVATAATLGETPPRTSWVATFFEGIGRYGWLNIRLQWLVLALCLIGFIPLILWTATNTPLIKGLAEALIALTKQAQTTQGQVTQAQISEAFSHLPSTALASGMQGFWAMLGGTLWGLLIGWGTLLWLPCAMVFEEGIKSAGQRQWGLWHHEFWASNTVLGSYIGLAVLTPLLVQGPLAQHPVTTLITIAIGYPVQLWGLALQYLFVLRAKAKSTLNTPHG